MRLKCIPFARRQRAAECKTDTDGQAIIMLNISTTWLPLLVVGRGGMVGQRSRRKLTEFLCGTFSGHESLMATQEPIPLLRPEGFLMSKDYSETDRMENSRYAVSTNRGQSRHRVRYVETGGAGSDLEDCVFCKSLPGQDQEGNEKLGSSSQRPGPGPAEPDSATAARDCPDGASPEGSAQ